MLASFIALLAVIAWLYLTYGHGGFWRPGPRLGDALPPDQWPDVAVVIPARNERETIAAAVKSHLGADYEGAISVFVIDDQSSDGTAGAAREAAAPRLSATRRFELVAGRSLPPGWTGKMWAVQTGLDRVFAGEPDAAYVLLTDADIEFAAATLRRLVAKAERERLALVSLMARLDMSGFWGALLMPAFVHFFRMLYPFPVSNDPDRELAAGAGGCMLIRTDALRANAGVAPIRSALIDDCALARHIKDLTPTTRTWIGLADREAVSLRDNRSLASIWKMVARTAYAQLGYSPAMLAACVAGLALVFLAPPVLALTFFVHGSFTALVLSLAAWSLMARTYWPILRHYGHQMWESVTLPLAAVFYLMMTISSAIRHWRGEGGQWKGRTYPKMG